MLTEWLRICKIGREEYNMKVFANKFAGLKVCKNHFREADFSGKHLNRQRFKSERRNLKKTAVP